MHFGSPHEPTASGLEQRPTAVFMGSPAFAVPSLDALTAVCRVTAVFTQPDRPAGRGRRLQPPPVKERALALQLPVYQPASLRRDSPDKATLSASAPDIIVVVAYGLLLPPDILALPRRGAVNVHASLLPRWRGAAPVAHAILAGDAESGTTIMLMDAGLDTGPILSQRALPLNDEIGCGELTSRLASMGAQLLVDTLPDWLAGRMEPRPQDEAHATYAARLTKADGRLHWELDAAVVSRRVRAMDPWPGAFCFWSRGRLKVLAAQPRASRPAGLPSGTVWMDAEGPMVACGRGSVTLDRLQAEGGRALTGSEFLLGHADLIGQSLTGDG